MFETQTVQRYSIFDRAVQSPIELPELAILDPEPEDGDIRLRFQAIEQGSLPSPAPGGLLIRHEHGRVRIAFPAATFRIPDAGNELIIESDTDAGAALVRHQLLDQAIPHWLAHRGELIVHASAVAMDGGCILLIGRSGQGKSTLALALAKHGATHLADDAVLLRAEENGVSCLPSYGGARLWQDSLAHVQLAGMQETLGIPTRSKHRYRPTRHRPARAWPLLGALVLAPNADPHAPPRLTDLSPMQRFDALAKHGFSAGLQRRDQLADHSTRIAAVSRTKARFARLELPRSLERLPDVCAYLTAKFRRL